MIKTPMGWETIYCSKPIPLRVILNLLANLANIGKKTILSYFFIHTINISYNCLENYA